LLPLPTLWQGYPCQIEQRPLPNRGGTPAIRWQTKSVEQRREQREESQTLIPVLVCEGKGGSRGKTAKAFDRFWLSYPRRVAKEAARKAFTKAIEGGTDPEVLIAGALRYGIERSGEEPRYTKHPATWLNGGCWQDEAPGRPIIDEGGNVVAFEQPQQRRPGRSAYDVAIDVIAAEEAMGKKW
jgi:hypothetical protein